VAGASTPTFRPAPRCDARCLARAERSDEPAVADETGGPFRLDDRVRHVQHGPGLVSRLEGDRIVVAFDDSGYRVRDVEAVLTRNLLRRED
jgi:hypothetical protein